MQVRNHFFCKDCGKELIYYNNIRKKYYSHKTRSGLCRKCCAKSVYKLRGVFTHSHGRLWTNEEIEILKNKYYNSTTIELKYLLNRNWASITHKANRLCIKRNPKFMEEGNAKGRQTFRERNPMLIKEIKDKVSKSLIEGYNAGRIKLSGIALKSSLGLTTKDNHPNWLGGISFEPYDKNFDDSFRKSILSRDNNKCLICNKKNVDESGKIKRRLCVHHVNYDKKLTIPENCCVLCNSCHMKTNYNRESWIIFFYNLLHLRYGYTYLDNHIVINLKCRQSL